MKTIILNQDAFKKPKWIFGSLAIGFGILASLEGVSYLSVLIPIGVFLFLVSSGLEIDTANMRYRYYKSFVNLRRGQWKSFASYSASTILKKQGAKVRPGPKLAYEHRMILEEHQVFLTDQSHRKRLYLKHFDTAEQARKYALGFKEKTGIPLERFNPVISEQTRNRR